MKIKFSTTLQQNIVPSIRDMAALFCGQLVDEGGYDLDLRVSCADGLVRAIVSRGAGYFNAVVPIEGVGEIPTGEVTRCVKLAVVDVLKQVTRQCPDMPWGVLTGVRPGKLGHKLVENGLNYASIAEYLASHYLVPNKQGKLLADIVALQDKIAPTSEAGLYIGIPFCPTKCSYCSFPSGIIPKNEEEQENFLKLIELDLVNVVQLLSMHRINVSSLYIGGGTPTSFTDKVFGHFMELVAKHVPSTIREFTVEAGRPDCFSKAKLQAMEAVGVNRVSVNPQTFHDKTLQRIGRRHSVAEFYEAYAMARESKIPIINMDLIIGLPGETEQDIAYSLECAAKLKPENLTVHTLTLKKDAALFQKQEEVSLSAEAAARMVELGAQTAAELGMVSYYLYRQHYMLGHLANVGYAMPGTESIYNIQMMEERHTVLAVGPSSSSKRPLEDGHHLRRHAMPKNIAVYKNTLEEQFSKRAELLK